MTRTASHRIGADPAEQQPEAGEGQHLRPRPAAHAEGRPDGQGGDEAHGSARALPAAARVVRAADRLPEPLPPAAQGGPPGRESPVPPEPARPRNPELGARELDRSPARYTRLQEPVRSGRRPCPASLFSSVSRSRSSGPGRALPEGMLTYLPHARGLCSLTPTSATTLLGTSGDNHRRREHQSPARAAGTSTAVVGSSTSARTFAGGVAERRRRARPGKPAPAATISGRCRRSCTSIGARPYRRA